MVTAVCLALYPQRFAQLHEHWVTAGDLDMGYLLLAVSAFLIVQRAKITKVRLNVLVLLATLLLSALVFVLDYLDIKSLFFFGFALLYYLSIWLVFGWSSLRSILLPLSLVFMAFPFWYLAIGVLHSLTTIVNHQLVDWLGITAIIDGNYIQLPTGTVHIARGCSGFKYFLAAATLAVIATIIRPGNFKEFLFNAVVIVALAIIANWVRVFILILVGYYIGMDHPLMADHDVLGWIVFVVFLVPWFFMSARLQRHITSQKVQTSSAGDTNSEQPQYAARFAYPFLTVVLVATLVYPALLFSWVDSKRSAAELQAWSPADAIAGYRRVSDRRSSWQPGYHGYSQSYTANYRRGVNTAEVVVLEYGKDATQEMVTEEHQIFASEEYELISDTLVSLGGKSGASDVRQLIARKKGARTQRVAYFWYAHGELRAITDLGSKIASARGLIAGLGNDRVVVVSIPCVRNCDAVFSSHSGLKNLLIELYERS